MSFHNERKVIIPIIGDDTQSIGTKYIAIIVSNPVTYYCKDLFTNVKLVCTK